MWSAAMSKAVLCGEVEKRWTRVREHPNRSFCGTRYISWFRTGNTIIELISVQKSNKHSGGPQDRIFSKSLIHSGQSKISKIYTQYDSLVSVFGDRPWSWEMTWLFNVGKKNSAVRGHNWSWEGRMRAVWRAATAAPHMVILWCTYRYLG